MKSLTWTSFAAKESNDEYRHKCGPQTTKLRYYKLYIEIELDTILRDNAVDFKEDHTRRFAAYTKSKRYDKAQWCQTFDGGDIQYRPCRVQMILYCSMELYKRSVCSAMIWRSVQSKKRTER